MARWVKRVLWGGAGLVALGTVAVAGYVWAVLPQVDGEATVTGLRQNLSIERDADGVPTIRGGSRDDVLFGLGYVHAQDRLWQLETHRRIGSGRLAEAFGPSAVDTDHFLRVLGPRRAAQAQWESVGPDARAAILAYTAGINAFIKESMRARPPEHVILGLEVEDWTPVDTLAWSIMMAWDLGGNWGTELLRLRLSANLPVERIQQLLPPYPGTAPLATADYADLYRSLKVDATLGQSALLAAPPSGIDGVGSNNWVVAGSHTTTGHPLLANDPHLKLSAPALWYFARLDAPGYKVAGATMPGLPMVVLGQNERIAWGFTNTAPDVQDLYLEQVSDNDANLYRTPEGWARFEQHEERIRVRGAEDVPIRVRHTRHGPVISDARGAVPGFLTEQGQGQFALALRWTALDADVRPVDVGLALNVAGTVEEFVTASRDYVAPMQSMVVADRDGRIGMVAAGRVPLRHADNDLKGLVPAPGWESRYDWVGFLDPDQTPRELDPSRGYVATANQRIHGPDYPAFLTSEWTVPYRQDRIMALLAARPKHDLDSLRAIQADEHSAASLKLLPHVQLVKSEHPLAAAAKAQLEGFDGVMSVDRAAPLILWVWARHMTEAVFADEVGDKLFHAQLRMRNFREALEGVLERQDAWWCDDKATAEVEDCAQLSSRAFSAALDELSGLQGSDVTQWRWGRAHVARSEHRPFSNVAALAPWFELRTPVGGDNYSVKVDRVAMRPDPLTGERYLSEHGASFRGLYDVANPENSRVMHSTGQSGIVFSSLYRRYVKPWTEVTDRPLWHAPTVHRLALKPAKP